LGRRYACIYIHPQPPGCVLICTDLILEQLARNRVFLGDDGLKKVRDAFVIVVGCGGVGSWTAAMLVRSGVGKVRLVDFDQVTLSSLNRHAVATLADVGTPKVLALRKHLEQVAPWVEIDARNGLWNKENGEVLLAGNPTYVVDAIDNIDTKVDLLHFCVSRGIPVISSMGAGCKSDPTRVCHHEISTAQTTRLHAVNSRSTSATSPNPMKTLSPVPRVAVYVKKELPPASPSYTPSKSPVRGKPHSSP